MPDIRYPLSSSTWGDAELDAMQRVIASGNFTMGKRVQAYEAEFAKFFGSDHAIMSNSGSSANLLGMSAIRYSAYGEDRRRDEVIVPAVSWSTTYFPVTQLGYVLKFVDVDLDTLNASVETVEAAISEKTAGIVAVNLLGNPSDLTSLRELADSNGIFLLEDNCESLGARFDGRLAGTFGDVGTFSSFFSHHMSTMEGGMALTNNLELSQVMMSLRAHGWTRDLPASNYVWDKSGDEFEDQFVFALPGYNLRPLELEGAIGSEQLKKVNGFVAQRRLNHSTFSDVMCEFPDIITQTELGQSSWFGFSMILSGRYAGQRKKLVNLLSQYGIESRPIVAGNFTRNPVLRHLRHSELTALPSSDRIHDDGLFVGNHHYDISEEIGFLGSVLREFFQRN